MNPKIDPANVAYERRRWLRTIVDGWVIPQPEPDAYRSGAFMAVPTIIGSIASEGGMLTAEVPTYSLPPHRTGEHENDRAVAASTSRKISALRSTKRGRTTAPRPTTASVPALAHVWGDGDFGYSVRSLAREISKRQPETFRYIFAHVGKYTSNPPVQGQDTTYVFGTGEFEARDRAVSDAIVAAFSNFAKAGDPNGPGAPRWTPYDSARDNYVLFGNDFAEGSKWRTAPADFLERFYRSLAT